MKKIFFIIFIAVCFLLLVAVSGYFFIRYQIGKPYSHRSIETVFVIHKGESSKMIAQNLEKDKLIKNNYYFLFYLWEKNLNDKLQAGEYVLRPNMSIVEMVNIFVEGAVRPNWIQITIPEGFNLRKIDARLAGAGLIKDEELLNFDIDRLSDLPFKLNLKSLEGLLFPDTYRFNKDDGVVLIIQKILNNFGKKITPEILETSKKQERRLYDVLIMASILEKEVKTDEDKKIVAGIFWKRLKKGQPLESCATIAYILGVDKWRYSYEDTRIKSPYNTYLNKGLPPTPINNPGLSAILAVLYPMESSYNYFLTDPETERTIFSKTFEEHLKNKVKYFK